MALLWLKARANSGFVCAEGGSGGPLVANRDFILEWESFLFEDLTAPSSELRIGDYVTLRAAGGQYVAAELGQDHPRHEVVANRATPTQSFRIVPAPGGEPLNTVISNKERPPESTSRKPTGTLCAIQTAAGTHWSARMDEGGRLTAEFTWIQSWEEFEIGFAGGNVVRPVYDVWRNNVAPIL